MGWHGRPRRGFAAWCIVVGVLTLSVPCAGSRASPAEDASASSGKERGCVSRPLGWDPHLDWGAGPPC
jgi:hypothetical protein